MSAAGTAAPAALILDGARLLGRHGGLMEVRIPKAPRAGTVSGYFTDPEALSRAVAPWDGRATIYVTLNPVRPDLLARAVNRLKPLAKATTADEDILRRVWLPLDFDPVRPAGISSTDAQVAAALSRRNEAIAFLTELGFPDPATGMSGNGGHGLYPIDLPNDAATTALIERALVALAARFSDDAVHVDTAVFNAARVWKLPGTVALKGDALPDRPHRRAVLEHVPAELVNVTQAQLKALAAMAPPARTVSGPANGTRPLPALNLVALVQARGWYLRPLHSGKHAITCPWAAEHSGDSGVTETCLFEPRAPGEPWGFDCKHAHCADRTIRDLLALVAPMMNGHGHHAPGGGTAPDDDAAEPGENEGTWPRPKPVPNDLPAVPAFDDRLLPAAFGPRVTDIAERAQCPLDFVAVAAVVGRTIAIRPKRHDDWAVVPNLWGLVVGRPGIMKSPALHEALKPLHRLVADARIAHQRQMTEHEFRVAEAKARAEALRKKLKDAVERGTPTEELRRAFEAPGYTVPVERRYLVNDSTVEKLGELLNQNPNGLLLFRDELAGFLRTMDREGHENDRAFYCEAWNGTGGYTYDRIGRGTTHIEAACVSVLGGIQPGPLHAYLREVFGDGAQDDGLIQRFQLMVYPDVAREWRNVDRWPDNDAQRRVVGIFQRLAGLDLAALGVQKPTPEERPFLRFTPEAQALFDAWRATLEQTLRREDESPVVLSHLAKYRSLMPTLALLFHVVESIDHGTGSPVSEDAAGRAIAWCDYLAAHARRVYHAVTAAPLMAAAALAAKLAAGALPTPFGARDLRRHQWTGLTEAAEVLPAIDWLCDLHWLRREDVHPAGGGRPTAQYRINPAVLGAAR